MYAFVQPKHLLIDIIFIMFWLYSSCLCTVPSVVWERWSVVRISLSIYLKPLHLRSNHDYDTTVRIFGFYLMVFTNIYVLLYMGQSCFCVESSRNGDIYLRAIHPIFGCIPP